jgi:hypothetical protein
VITQRVVVISDLHLEPISPETSVRNYPYSLCNNPKQRCSRPLRGGNLKSRHISTLARHSKAKDFCSFGYIAHVARRKNSATVQTQKLYLFQAIHSRYFLHHPRIQTSTKTDFQTKLSIPFTTFYLTVQKTESCTFKVNCPAP